MHAAWRSLALPVDAVHVSVGGGGPYAPEPVIIGRDELAERFGAGPHGAVWSAAGHPPSDSIWLLLPAAYAALAFVMIVFARRLRRAGVVVVIFRR